MDPTLNPTSIYEASNGQLDERLRKMVRVLTRASSHLDFILACLRNNVVPKGLRIRTSPQVLQSPTSDLAEVFDTAWRKILKNASILLMKTLKRYYKGFTAELIRQVETRKQDIQVEHGATTGNDIIAKTVSSAEPLAKRLMENRKKKLEELVKLTGGRKRHPRRLNKKLKENKPVDNPTPSTVVNLSGKPLCPGELQLLSRGLSFCPRPPKLNSTEILDDLERYNRRLRLKEYFATVEAMEDDRRPFRPPSNWMPPKGRNDALEVFISQVRRTVEQSLEARATWRAKDNISMDERRALKSLRERTDIVIKPADKGSAVVIMSQEGYIAEVNRQLQNTKHCKLLDASPLMEITAEVTSMVRDLLRRDVIDCRTQRFLLPRE